MDWFKEIRDAQSLGRLREIEGDIRQDSSLTPGDISDLTMLIMDREEDFGVIRLD